MLKFKNIRLLATMLLIALNVPIIAESVNNSIEPKRGSINNVYWKSEDHAINFINKVRKAEMWVPEGMYNVAQFAQEHADKAYNTVIDHEQNKNIIEIQKKMGLKDTIVIGRFGTINDDAPKNGTAYSTAVTSPNGSITNLLFVRIDKEWMKRYTKNAKGFIISHELAHQTCISKNTHRHGRINNGLSKFIDYIDYIPSFLPIKNSIFELFAITGLTIGAIKKSLIDIKYALPVALGLFGTIQLIKLHLQRTQRTEELWCDTQSCNIEKDYTQGAIETMEFLQKENPGNNYFFALFNGYPTDATRIANAQRILSPPTNQSMLQKAVDKVRFNILCV